jgi:ribulose-phosphate 3-epimerase
MVERPEAFTPQFATAGADIITVHAETCVHLHRVVHQIKSLGKGQGSPSTPPPPSPPWRRSFRT